jgi:hypothetical protein
LGFEVLAAVFCLSGYTASHPKRPQLIFCFDMGQQEIKEAPSFLWGHAVE